MPYICLSRADIPDGTLQVLDLWPNTSQRNNSIDPPGQTRYVNRVQSDAVALRANRSFASAPRGLAAYLADRVEPGGTQVAVGTVQMVGPTIAGPDTVTIGGTVFTAVENTAVGTILCHDPTAAVGRLTVGLSPLTCYEATSTGTITILGGCAAGDIVTIAGVPFTAVNGAPVLANQEFQDVAGSGSDILTAGSLVASINEATPLTGGAALLTAALDALVVAATAGTLTGANGGTAVVTLTPSVMGVWGDATLVENSAGVRITLSGAAMAHVAPNPAAVPSQFGSAAYYEGTAIDVSIPVATSVVAAINDAANQVLILAAYAGPPPAALDGTVTAANGGGTLAVVSLLASLPGFSGRLDVTTTEAGQLVLSAATLVQTAANPALFQFDTLINSTAGTDITSAASLAAALNNANSDAAFVANGFSTVTAANGGTDTATLTADTAGSTGPRTITDTAGARILGVSMAKAYVTWTAAHLNAAAVNIIARVDAGTALALANINTAINAVAGVSGTGVTGGTSTGTVRDILSILSGREYTVPVNTNKDVSGINWSAVAAGAFTTPNTVFDSGMQDGEWRPAGRFMKFPNTGPVASQTNNVTGGDVVNNEVGGIRYNPAGGEVEQSVRAGELAALQLGTITLFPDSDLSPFYATTYQPGPVTAQVANARLVTVYNDDGTLTV